MTSEFPPQPGGIGNHAFNLARSLSEADYEVTVLADQRSQDGTDERLFDSNLKFKIKRTKFRKIRALMYLSRLQTLTRLAKQNDFIIASGKFSLWAVGLFANTADKNKLAVIHGTEVILSGKANNLLTKSSLEKFKTLIAVSNYTKNLLSLGNQEKTVVIPNGFNEKIWPINNESKSYSKKPILISVGNVNYRKGQQNVIKKLPELLKKYPNAEYHCVGLSTRQKEFEDLAKHLGVNDSVVFHGSVSQEKLMKLVQISDILVMLSTPNKTGDVEGFGIAIIEGNSQGLPAIGSKDCGIEDAIDDNQSGILIDFDDTNEFIEAIDAIDEQYSHFSVRAKSWAKKHYWENIAERYIEMIEG